MEAYVVILPESERTIVSPTLWTQRHRVGIERQVDGQVIFRSLTVMKMRQMRSPTEFLAKG